MSMKTRSKSCLNYRKITQKDYDHLYPTSESIPRMYCTPLYLKNTQAGDPTSPIVYYTGSIGYATSRYMAHILAPLIGKTDHHVANSQQLAEDLAEVGEMFNPTMWYHSSPMYPSMGHLVSSELDLKVTGPLTNAPPFSRWPHHGPSQILMYYDLLCVPGASLMPMF